MRLLSLFMLLPLLGVVSSQCTPSTLVEAGIPYDCMMNLSSEVTIHWIREIFGQAQFVATTTSVTGWFSISFPRNLGSMFPAIGVATTGATTTGIFSFSERTAAGITSVSSRLFHNPTTEIANGMRFLRFRINSDFMYSATAVNFAFHSSEMEFPVSKHTSVGSVAVSFVEPRVVVTEPALVPTCTASTLFKTESTTYDCMSALSPDVTLHWDQVEVIQGLPFHLQRAGVAATTTSVNGWFSVSFPEIPGSMVPALGVATTSATDASIYAFHERTAGGIISRQSFTPSTIQSPSTEIVNDMRILRFYVHTAFLIAAAPVNFAFHSSEMEFPVSKHTTAGSVIVNFREPPQVLPPTEPVVSPPTEPVVTPPPEPEVTRPAENSINFEVVAELSDLVTQIETLVAAASSSLGGNARCDMLCQGSNCLKCDGTAVTQRSVTTLVRGNWKVILIIINNENGSITKEAIDSSLKNVLSNNAVIGYVEGSAAVVVVVTDVPQVVVVNDGFIDAHTHGSIMVAVWAYWVPLSVIIKVLGALVCKREVFGYPIPVLIHMFMMVMAMCFTTVFASFALSDFNNRVDYGHKELGITLLVIGWIQVLSGLVRPGGESQYRKYWGWGHVLFGISVVIIAIAQMASGVENIKRLFPNDSNDVQIVLIVGLVTMGVIYIVGKTYVAVTKKAVNSIAENNETKHCEPDCET